MRGTGHRVLGNADAGCEEPAHIVRVLAGRGHQQPSVPSLLELGDVRLKRLHRFRVLEHGEEVLHTAPDVLDLGARQDLGEVVVGRLRRIAREVQGHPAVLGLGAQLAAAGGVDLLAAEDVRGGDGGVPAEVDLGLRREPAQGLGPLAGRHDEGRLGVLHLGGDVLHPAGVGRFVQ